MNRLSNTIGIPSMPISTGFTLGERQKTARKRQKNAEKTQSWSLRHCAGEIPCASMPQGSRWAAGSCKPEFRGRAAFVAPGKTIRSVGCPTPLKPFSPYRLSLSLQHVLSKKKRSWSSRSRPSRFTKKCNRPTALSCHENFVASRIFWGATC